MEPVSQEVLRLPEYSVALVDFWSCENTTIYISMRNTEGRRGGGGGCGERIRSKCALWRLPMSGGLADTRYGCWGLFGVLVIGRCTCVYHEVHTFVLSYFSYKRKWWSRMAKHQAIKNLSYLLETAWMKLNKTLFSSQYLLHFVNNTPKVTLLELTGRLGANLSGWLPLSLLSH